ncbi:hypothetical protein B296_00004598 [Ensete ventricosum]|uniref:Uncharacterized protein n=1 Tax=Ensete ventricosum TaxID=4639 RepID=A0A427AK91_ENSVE|nr:hypothetical protein B296_00004598 [Ensete ventricosum]
MGDLPTDLGGFPVASRPKTRVRVVYRPWAVYPPAAVGRCPISKREKRKKGKRRRISRGERKEKKRKGLLVPSPFFPTYMLPAKHSHRRYPLPRPPHPPAMSSFPCISTTVAAPPAHLPPAPSSPAPTADQRRPSRSLLPLAVASLPHASRRHLCCHTFLPCSYRRPASPQPQPPPTGHRCPSPRKPPPPPSSASIASATVLILSSFLTAAATRPLRGLPLLCRRHLCSSPFFPTVASLLPSPPSAAYNPTPSAHTHASATQSLPPLHQLQSHPSCLLLSHCCSPCRTIAALFLPPLPAAVFTAPFALLTLPACRSSAVVAAPSSTVQPPLPTLLPHLPSLLLPCFLLPLLVVVAFLFNRSLTCHVVASLSPAAALTAANRLCPPLADADNLVAVKSYYIYDICL